MPTPIKATTQEHLDILDITNNLIILRSGRASLVMQVNAINFDLLSGEEQEATIYAYAGLLNSLSFPIQILIRSQRKDITAYISLLKNQESKQLNPVYQKRIAQYRVFVEKLVKERNVLDKKFYVIIPYSEYELGLTPNALNPLAKKTKKPSFDKAYIIQKALNSLEPKRDHLIRQFSHLGLSAKQLANQELIQLFYHIYNPDSSEGVYMATSSQYQTPIIQSALRPPTSNPSTSTSTPPADPAVIAQPANLPTATPTPNPPIPTPPQPSTATE